MQNTSKLGCFGFLALCVAVYFLWIAVLYVGIPLAIVSGAVSAHMFSRYRDDDTGHGDDMRFIAATLAGGAVVLGLVSLAGNIFTDLGPLGHGEEAPAVAARSSSENRIIDICTDAVSAPTDDQFGIGSYMNGTYESATVTPSLDGTTVVRVVRSRGNDGRCPSKLVGSCTMKGNSVLHSSELREDGYFAC